MSVDFYTKEKSPCLDCEHREREKNHDDCVKCERRLAYIETVNPKPLPRDPIALHHIPETLPRPKRKRGRPSKNIKQLTPTEKYDLNEMSKASIGEKINKIINKPETPKINSILDCQRKIAINLKGYPDIYDKLISMAEDQVRTIEQQIIFLIKKGIS